MCIYIYIHLFIPYKIHYIYVVVPLCRVSRTRCEKFRIASRAEPGQAKLSQAEPKPSRVGLTRAGAELGGAELDWIEPSQAEGSRDKPNQADSRNLQICILEKLFTDFTPKVQFCVRGLGPIIIIFTSMIQFFVHGLGPRRASQIVPGQPKRRQADGPSCEPNRVGWSRFQPCRARLG